VLAEVDHRVQSVVVQGDHKGQEQNELVEHASYRQVAGLVWPFD
jgi:hypothetical protein